MRKTALSRTIRRTTILLLFLSIMVLMLNSFLPIVILKNPEVVYFNIENMQYSQNIDVQNLYNDINLINIFIWLIIIFIFIAFFGVIITISKIYEKISYLFLSIGCLSVIFSSISCYLYFIFISKVTKLENILLSYINIEQIKYSYIILILLIIITLLSISYIITTLPYLFKTLKYAKSNEQELTEIKEKTVTKSFLKPTDDKESFYNNKQVISEDFNFKKKKEFTERWLANEMNKIDVSENTNEQDFEEDLKENYIKKETMNEQITIDNKNIEHSDEKISPFFEENKKEKPKQKKGETSEVKISESFEKALFSAIDKKKKGEISQENFEKKEKSIKKYRVKCPECNYIFTKEKNEEGVTKIICPRCGKKGVIR